MLSFILKTGLLAMVLSGFSSDRHTAAITVREGGATFMVAAPKTIHVLVALCDNKYQGIVPVPARIGNGQNPDANLYWGCGYGIRSFFKKSKEWSFVSSQKIDSTLLERVIFKHNQWNYCLVADAYNGKDIRACTRDFLRSCAGQKKDSILVNARKLGLYGQSALLAYIGHDGLMDFTLQESFANADGISRDAIILACASKSYFAPHLKQTKARPLVWTTGLMCPEAYTLHDALTGYVNREQPQEVRMRAAKAYAKYQKCGEKAAMRLLVGGY